MPSPSLHPLSILQRYAAGFFPMIDDSDPAAPSFYWDRCPIRAVLPVNADTAARARRMARRAAPRFTLRYNTALEPILRHLRRAKEHSWVQGHVLDIYRTLHAANVLHTIEAWTHPAPTTRSTSIEHRKTKIENPKSKIENPRTSQLPITNHQLRPPRPRLVGALLGIVLPGVFIAETMVGLVPDASKVCLCRLVEDCHAAGFAFIDAQTPHDTDEFGDPLPRASRAKTTAHPCIRLGEQHLPHNAFLTLLQTTLTRHFPGTLADWLALAQHPTPAEPLAPDDPRRYLLPASPSLRG